MIKKNKIYKIFQQRYAKAIKKAKLRGMDSFQSWFDKAENTDKAIINGYWDFAFHIFTPIISKYLKNTQEKIALEIGYGGGRLLNVACNHFKKVIGIDIHNEKKIVEMFLKSQGKKNFKLIKIDGRKISMPSQSIDFIYSFIVLQHLPTFVAFLSYLKESYRCLKVGGIAQLYFGKYEKLNLIDQLLYYRRGYKETPNAPVNQTSLVIRTSKVLNVCQNISFKVIAVGDSYKRGINGFPKYKGGQNYVTLLKDK